MPELPEVETIKQQLNFEIINLKIKSVYTANLTLRGKIIPDLKKIKGENILNIYRRNKYLVFELNNYFLLIHLGMTGQLVIDKQLPNKKHIHAYFEFDNKILYYQDARRFGKIEIYDKKDYLSYLDLPEFKNLGFEPLEDNFTLESFKNILNNIKNKNMNLKQFIMDGKYVCGIGNIYANEILFLSKINPQECIKNLKENDISILYDNILLILNKAIELGGSTISDFVHVNGESGKMQNFYKVYNRFKKPCFVCGTNIERIKQQGRSSFFCPNCQNMK